MHTYYTRNTVLFTIHNIDISVKRELNVCSHMNILTYNIYDILYR